MKPLLLCILDGYGYSEKKEGNAILNAKTPHLDYLFNNYPHSLLEASGKSVGLPEGQMGNSEVGHQNIGAGRIVFQQIQIINNAIENGTFFDNEKFLKLFDFVKRNNSKLHLIGLVSDGGVHSKLSHLLALLDLCKKENVNNVYIHIMTDGRDTLPHSALSYIDKLQEKINTLNIGTIASIGGRYFGMDRDNRYDRVQKEYDVLTGESDIRYNSYQEAIEENYSKNITDEFIVPGLIDENGVITDNDGVIFFNYRPDRLRELGSCLSNDKFNGFERKKTINIKLVTMMPVSDEVVFTHAFDLQKLNNTLGEYLSKNNIKQLRIAETEKYAHVTYYFDGGVEKALPNSNRVLIPSPKVAYYDETPQMSALEITDYLLENMDKYDVIILNYANGDMVGHTGNFDAAIKAVETLDECVFKLYQKIESLKGTLIITADHGNCEKMLDDDGNVLTSHTTNKVPFLINKNIKLKDGKLGDIAPTILKYLNIKIPPEMTGKVLIED